MRGAGKLVVIFFMACSGLFAWEVGAAPRVERLDWTHPTPSLVEGFEIHYGNTTGVYDRVIDVGHTFSHDLVIDDTQDFFVVAVAYDGVSSSVPSNERVFYWDDLEVAFVSEVEFVPEPGAGGVALLALLWLRARRRRS